MKMDKIKEMIETRKSKIYERMGGDKKYTGDPIIGRYMEGKATAEQDEFNFYVTLLQEMEDL